MAKTNWLIWRDVAILVVIAAALFAGIYLAVPKSCKQAVTSAPTLGRELEAKLGAQFERAIAEDPKAVKDPVVLKAVGAVMDRLGPAATNLPFPIKMHVIQNREVNAFTFPGGVLVIYTGLLARSSGPEEVAAVVAHELGHVAGRDSVRALGAQLGLAALMALVTGGDPGVLADLVSRVMQTRYSKVVEAQADDYALETLKRASLSPKHMATFFGRLEKAEGPDTAWLKWLDGHPDLTSRRLKAEKAAAAFSPQIEKPIAVNWALVKARLPGMFD